MTDASSVPAGRDEDAAVEDARSNDETVADDDVIAAAFEAAASVEGSGDGLPAGLDAPAWFIPVAFVDVEMTLPSTHPVLILEEVDAPYRQLRIPIGMAEGSAIAYAARRIPTPRPLTHELVTEIFESFDITLETVRIVGATGNVFAAEAVFASPVGLRSFSCRPSDGVCLALRQALIPPIAVASEVLAEMGYDRDQLPR